MRYPVPRVAGPALMQAVFSELLRIVGTNGCMLEPDPDDPRLLDERQNYRGRAAAIVSPRTTEEVAKVVAACSRAGLAVVPQGGNTGYCGGATPDERGRSVLLCLSRMNRIRKIDTAAATLTAEAGVVLADGQAAAAEHGLLLPLGMGSQGSCQLGGNLSTNAGGLSVLRYGTARELVAGLEVVLPDGQVFSDLRGLRKDNTGYDLKQLFLGAEGTLGVITAAVLRLQPKPRCYLTAWLAIENLSQALRLLGELRAGLGDCITSCEYIASEALALVLTRFPDLQAPLSGHDRDHALVELAAFDDGDAMRAGFERVAGAALADGTLCDAVVAQTETQRRALWTLRESVPAAEKRAGGSVKHDVSVPLGALPELAHALCERTLERFPGARLSVYGHVGDGNLHFNVLSPEHSDAAAYRRDHAEAISRFVHGATLASGGSFSAEHGVGQLKRGLLAATASPVELDLMRRLKGALDPENIMNPGKVL
jgi:FAD/FMN-containing dehydrogenase